MKRIVRWLWIAVAVVAAQLGLTWLQRHAANVDMERRLASRRVPAEFQNPGKGVKIEQFYARSAEMIDGERNLVCYGVRNARTVRLEPPVEEVSPALVRCFWIEPRQDTAYQLIAEGFDGSREQAAFVVHVKPAPPEFRFVEVSDRQIPRGEVLTVCYGVEHATGVRLDPLGWKLPASSKNCVRFYPKGTLTYSLVAAGEGGTLESERFRVRVQ